MRPPSRPRPAASRKSSSARPTLDPERERAKQVWRFRARMACRQMIRVLRAWREETDRAKVARQVHVLAMVEEEARAKEAAARATYKPSHRQVGRVDAS